MMAQSVIKPCGAPPAFAAQLPRLSMRQHSRRAQRAAAQPWRFDDLSSPSENPSASALTTFDDLWRHQMRAMDRAQSEMADMHRQMDQQFEAAQRQARQLEQQSRAAGSSSNGSVQEESSSDGGYYRWQRSYERTGADGSYREFRSESFTMIGVPHSSGGGMGMYAATPPTAAHLGPLPALGLLLAAAAVGFWVAASAAFHRHFHLTTYKERTRWQLLLLWPVLLVTSTDFRQQFWAAVRGKRAAAVQQCQRQQAASGSVPDGEQFMPSMQASEQA